MNRRDRFELHRVVFVAALASAVVTLLLAAFTTSNQADAQPFEWEITEVGLGPVTVGATVDNVRVEIPDGYELGDEVAIAPDLVGRVISVDGAVQALLATVGDRVSAIIVLGDTYRTPDGIGPGSLVSDAEAVYGAATLRWSPDDEGRERVEFANGPVGLSFRTSEAVGPQAGVYEGDETTTTEYDSDSRLTSVWVVDAGATPPPEPTAEPTPEATAEPTPEPTAEPTPQPTPEPTADVDDEGQGDEGDERDGAGDGAVPDDEASEDLPVTGRASLPVGIAALTVLFLGLGVARAGDRRKPWS